MLWSRPFSTHWTMRSSPPVNASTLAAILGAGTRMATGMPRRVVVEVARAEA